MVELRQHDDIFPEQSSWRMFLEKGEFLFREPKEISKRKKKNFKTVLQNYFQKMLFFYNAFQAVFKIIISMLNYNLKLWG